MTTEQIEQAQVPAVLAKNAMTGRVIAAKNARLDSLANDTSWTASGLAEWWYSQSANHASIGRCGYMAAMQGAAWMLGKMYDADPQQIYKDLECFVGMD